MFTDYTKTHHDFKLNGKHYNAEALKKLSKTFLKSELVFEKHIGEFLVDWLSESEFINLQTSGSTGKPKTIAMSKQKMINSALATRDFFNLQPKNKALLCLPAHYIAGKMMLVRAILIGLELDCIEPKTKLQISQSKFYDFAAMVPMQLEANLNIISNLETLIIGGAQVSLDLISKIKNYKPTVFETYGMTETVSHIAVKQLNNFSSKTIQKALFKTLPGISIAQNEKDCLVIDAPLLSDEKVITNDIVKLHSKTTFEWLGRYDNIINSGGIKVFPEQIERQLQDKINSRFFIASEEDSTLGKRVILIVEGEKNSINTSVFNTLDSYSKPKAIYYLDRFVETTSGKIQRKKTLQLLKK